jgi:hypothetical protein
MKGLVHANLAALLTRGPWASSTWDPATRKGVACQITPDDLAALVKAIGTGRTNFHTAIGAYSAADRKCDRALQLLRKAGVIEYAGTPKRWRVVGGGS